MINLDSSIIPATVIFLSLVVSLNYLLFQPLIRIQAERGRRTTGTFDEAHGKLNEFLKISENYQAAIRNARMEAYRLQERIRSEARNERAEALQRARKAAEQMIKESHGTLEAQLQAAKMKLSQEADDLARGIAAVVLRRSA